MSIPRKNVLSMFHSLRILILTIWGCILSVYLISISRDHYVAVPTGTNPLQKREIKVQPQVKTILYWTRMFNDKHFYFGEGDVFQSCPVSACRATAKRDDQLIDQFDAILFHGIQVDPSDLPLSRSRKQRYVFVDLESPANWKLKSKVPEGFYNWTMTYRLDSDVPRPYGVILDERLDEVVYPVAAREGKMDLVRETDGDLTMVASNNTRGGKRRPVAWIVSRCSTVGKRHRYVAELKKHIDVDVYGKCGNQKCPPGKDTCHEMLDTRYYFYLSFENSLCEDYVTEKLYKILKYNVVPVVFGGANYSRFAPPRSFINVADFESPKHLATYLKRLVNDKSEYEKYFRWKRYYKLGDNHRFTLCKLCEKLHEEGQTEKIVFRLEDWWGKDKCRDPQELLKNIS